MTQPRTWLLSLLLPFNSLHAAEVHVPAERVVCIHGILSPKELMAPAAHRFKKEGMEVHNWGYRSTKGTIGEHAEDLVGELKDLAKEAPGVPISFFTHSMGALVLRAALNHPGCPKEAKVGRAVLVGPPNRGSQFARGLYTWRSLRWVLGKGPGLELMTTPRDGFDGLGDFPKEMEVLVIAGTLGCNRALPRPHDGRVALEETRLDTPHEFTTVKVGHPLLPMSYRVIGRASHFLRKGGLASFSRAR